MGQTRDDKLEALLENQPVSDGDQRRLQVRKNSQQALLYLSSEVAPYNQRFYTYPSSSTPSLPLTRHPLLKTNSYRSKIATGAGATYGAGTAGSPSSQGWTSGYKNIVPILATPRLAPGLSLKKQAPDLSVTRLTALKAQVNRFFNFEITSAQMAAMVPKIEIYKLDYKMKNGKIDRSQDPDRRHIVFDKAITEQEMADFVLKGGNLGSSGIESFRWALKGVNPAEVDTNIEATLKVYFNNVNVFQRALDEIKKATARGVTPDKMPASFIDLITFAPPTTKTTADLPCLEDYDPYYFEIEVQLGWNCPEAFPSDVKAHIKEQNVSLFLTLTDHKFAFREDGSATLEVNYRARSTMNDRGHDILLQENGALIAARKALSDAESAVTTAQQDGGEATATDQALVDAAEKDLKKAFETTHRRLIGNILNQAYVATVPNALLLSAVGMTKTMTSYQGNTTGTYDVTANGYMSIRQLMELARGSGSSADFDNIMTRLASDFKNRVKTVSVKRRPLDNTKDLSKDVIDADTDFAQEDKVNDSWFSDDLSKGIYDSSRINFLYLGDILEVILQVPSVVSSLRKNKLAVITTDFKFLNYYALLAAAKKNTKGVYELGAGGIALDKLRCAQGKLSSNDKKTLYSSINMANIPINLELFLDFYVNKVIRSGRTSYYLEDFLNDIFNSLVKPSLADPGIYGAAPQQPALININVETDTNKSPIYGPGSKAGQQSKMSTDPPVVNNGSDLSFVVRALVHTGMYPVRPRPFNIIWSVDHYTQRAVGTGGGSARGTIVYRDKEALPSPSSATLPKHCGVTKVLGVSANLDAFDGDYVNNDAKSIKNFVVGLDRGIVKSITFDRVDQPYLREARTAKSKNFGTGQLRELYNATLTLYGNNLLKPGEIIYVEANSLIFGKPTIDNSVSRVLGLGGYHLVVDVENPNF